MSTHMFIYVYKTWKRKHFTRKCFLLYSELKKIKIKIKNKKEGEKIMLQVVTIASQFLFVFFLFFCTFLLNILSN